MKRSKKMIKNYIFFSKNIIANVKSYTKSYSFSSFSFFTVFDYVTIDPNMKYILATRADDFYREVKVSFEVLLLKFWR